MKGIDRMEVLEQGSGRVERQAGLVRLLRSSASTSEYSNAQVGDSPEHPHWNLPLRLTVRARFSHSIAQLRGTAGFGFWNAPFAPGAWRLRCPQAVWFFLGAPPYDVPVALGVPGSGFKAAVLDARRLAFFALLPTAPVGFLLMRRPSLYRRLWPIAQRAIGASEASLNHLDLTEVHTYALHWEANRARFDVDGQTVLRTPTVPTGPLSFVAWIDNSYAIATPQGRFGAGLVDEMAPQWLDLEHLAIKPSQHS